MYSRGQRKGAGRRKNLSQTSDGDIKAGQAEQKKEEKRGAGTKESKEKTLAPSSQKGKEKRGKKKHMCP